MRYNVLKSCAALSCRACVDETTCVAERYLTLRTGCSRGRTPKVVRPQQRKNPLPYSFSQRSHIGNLRQIRKQGKGRSPKRKGNRRCPFLFAHRRGYGVVPCGGRRTLPRSAERNSQLRFSGKLPARKGQPACGSSRTPVLRCRKGAARQGEHADAVRVPRSAGAENKAVLRLNCFFDNATAKRHTQAETA